MLLLSVLVRFLSFLNDLNDLRDMHDKLSTFQKIVGGVQRKTGGYGASLP